MKKDPIIQEVLAARRAIARRHGDDLEAIFADAMQRQTGSRRLVKLSSRQTSRTVPKVSNR